LEYPGNEDEASCSQRSFHINMEQEV
jgi:hypothetical protein